MCSFKPPSLWLQQPWETNTSCLGYTVEDGEEKPSLGDLQDSGFTGLGPGDCGGDGGMQRTQGDSELPSSDD